MINQFCIIQLLRYTLSCGISKSLPAHFGLFVKKWGENKFKQVFQHDCLKNLTFWKRIMIINDIWVSGIAHKQRTNA
jgi:hypothetical protein